jgi:hypothetical protein
LIALKLDDGTWLNICDEQKMAKVYLVHPGDYSAIPGFTNQGLVVLGAAGGAMYAQRPSDYRRQRWDVTLRMDNGQTRVVSLRTEPLLVQEGDYVRVSGNSLELLTP